MTEQEVTSIIREREAQGRDKALGALFTMDSTITAYTTPINERWDFWLKEVNNTTATTEPPIIFLRAEAKDRDNKIDTYNDHMLDKNKYDYLMTLTAHTCLYINTYNDGNAAIWDLSKVKPTRTGKAWVYKVDSDPSQGKCWKDEVYFKLDQAIWYGRITAQGKYVGICQGKRQQWPIYVSIGDCQ